MRALSMTLNQTYWIPLLLALPVLSGCVNDAASMQIDGKEHSISVVREQKWLWEQRVDLYAVVSRMPDCQRRHRLKNSSIASSGFEMYTADYETFYLQQANRTYMVETKTCEGFRELTETPSAGIGQKIGAFKEVGGQYKFVEEPMAGAKDVAKPQK